MVPLVASAATVAVGTAIGMTIGYLQGPLDTLVLVLVDVLLVLGAAEVVGASTWASWED